MSRTHRLSKSRFLSGYQCQKKLWLEKHQHDLKTPFSNSQQRILDSGTHVGELATEHFPGGVLIGADHLHVQEALKETTIALEQDASPLFEGCFIYDDILVRPDIMVREQDATWKLIEVKSTTSVKDENIVDVAVQKYVLEGCGLKISSSHLMHIDNSCVYPNLENLFNIEEISERVDAIKEWIPAKAKEFFRTLGLKEEPTREIGEHCSSPYKCPFISYCWQHVPEYSIFTIPNYRWTRKQEDLENDILDLEEVDEAKLNEKQLKYQQSYRTQKTIIDKPAIKDLMKKLQYPLYFFDFETDSPAIPRFNGMHPYEKFPFQFSCHVLHEDGALIQTEYLHEDLSDPRCPLAEAMLNAIGPTGTIVAYNIGFEKGVIKLLSGWLPDLSRSLNALLPRFWDQLPIFRNHYTDYQFHGSASIKSVLPVLVPELNYSDLEVGDGTQAQVSWNEMINCRDPEDKAKLRDNLFAYCGQDTLAMVRIHQYLASMLNQK